MRLLRSIADKVFQWQFSEFVNSINFRISDEFCTNFIKILQSNNDDNCIHLVIVRLVVWSQTQTDIVCSMSIYLSYSYTSSTIRSDVNKDLGLKAKAKD